MTKMNSVYKIYSYLNNKTFQYKTEGARMAVYTTPKNPNIVLKVVTSAQHLADKFAGWGIPLDQQSWAPVKGNAIASARRMLDDSIESFSRAHQHLNGLAVPFVILNGRDVSVPDGSFKLRESDGSEVEKNFKGTIALVQERIQIFEEFVPSFVEAGKERDLFSIFQGFVDLTLALWKRGLFFEVLNFHNDYGINKDNKVLISDIGELTHDEKKAVEYIKNRKMFEEYAYRDWLSKKYLQLAEFYKKIVDQDLTAERVKRLWGTEANRPENQVIFDENLLFLS